MVFLSIDVAQITLSKGFQFTLPAKNRKKHGLKPGQKIQVIDLADEIILRPIKKRSILESAGKFKGKKGFDAVLEKIRPRRGFFRVGIIEAQLKKEFPEIIDPLKITPRD